MNKIPICRNAPKTVALNQLCTKGVSALRQKDVANDGPYPVYGASGVVGYSSSYQNEKPYVAVVKDGAGVGRASLCCGKSSVLGTMQALLPVGGVDCRYLLHLVRSMRLGDGFTGSTIPHIYFKDYGTRELPRHGSDEQTTIAITFSSIENLVEMCNVQIRALDDLVKSQFSWEVAA